MKNDWQEHTLIDYNDTSIMSYHVDTRDFYVSANDTDCSDKFDLDKLYRSKHSQFFHNGDEVKQLIERYYMESGGEAEWRMFCLQGAVNWELKYIRIYRTKYGLLVCSSSDYALNKEHLSKSVDKEHLH